MKATAKKRPNLKAMLLSELQPGLAKEGFARLETVDWFERKRGDLEDYYAFEFHKEVRGYTVQPAIHVRSHTLSQIFHKISEVKPEDQVYSTAIACVAWRVLGDKDAFACALGTEDDVKPAARKLMKIFKNTVLPFYDRFQSIADIDRLYNSDPEVPKFRMYLVDFWVRRAYATIAAKLVGNPRYDTIVEQNMAVLKESEEPERAIQYQKLLKVLEKVKVQS